MRNLNEFQHRNLQVLKPNVIKKLETGEWQNIPIQLLRCSRCGAGISILNLEYFGFSGIDVLCYSCQEEINK